MPRSRSVRKMGLDLTGLCSGCQCAPPTCGAYSAPTGSEYSDASADGFTTTDSFYVTSSISGGHNQLTIEAFWSGWQALERSMASGLSSSYTLKLEIKTYVGPDTVTLTQAFFGTPATSGNGDYIACG